MVFCLSHFLPLLLVPYPTAAPLFVIVYLVTLFVTRKPCVYCTVLLSALFISTCYTYSPPSDDLSTALANSTSANASLPTADFPSDGLLNLSSPDASRCWCDLNSAHILSPVLLGYRQSSSILASAPTSPQPSHESPSLSTTSSDDESNSTSQTLDSITPLTLLRSTFAYIRTLLISLHIYAPPLPPIPAPLPPTTSLNAKIREEIRGRWDSTTKRLDLRLKGQGMILDFGFGRGEETVRLDLERMRRSRGKATEEHVRVRDSASMGAKDEL